MAEGKTSNILGPSARAVVIKYNAYSPSFDLMISVTMVSSLENIVMIAV